MRQAEGFNAVLDGRLGLRSAARPRPNMGGLHLHEPNICRRRFQDAGFDAPERGDLSRKDCTGQ